MCLRRRIWTAAAALGVLWVGLAVAIVRVHRDLNLNRPTPLAMADAVTFWPAPGFSFTDQDGGRVTDASLRGHPYVADFIFTTCTTACPTLTAQLALLRRQVTSPAARFVSFSVDPVHDTPAALNAYARQWGAADPRWRLLGTDLDGLAAVVKGFRVTAEPSGDPANPILHSTLFLLVDAEGTVRGIYDSTDADALARLSTDLRALLPDDQLLTTAVTVHATDAAGRGHQAFAALGCMACHAQPRVAPPLTSLYNSMVRLSDGRTAWADSAYLHESIVNPGAKVVAGYLNSMPSYRGHLSDDQATDLVAYVESLSGNPPGGHGFVARAGTTRPAVAAETTDPVCHMRVATNPATPHETVGGRTFYFCSDACRDRFTKEPAAFTGTGGNGTGVVTAKSDRAAPAYSR